MNTTAVFGGMRGRGGEGRKRYICTKVKRTAFSLLILSLVYVYFRHPILRASSRDVSAYLSSGVFKADHVSPGSAYDIAGIADGCRLIYFDVGSNIGVQVRKLFEPEKYPEAKILSHFEQAFGSPDFRRSNYSGICVFGFEANPSHFKHLKRLEDCYQNMGWRVHFFPAAAGAVDGNVSFYSDDNPNYEEWAASIFDHSNKDHVSVVPMYDLARFLKAIRARRLPKDTPLVSVAGQPQHAEYSFMKLDIEGSEFSVLSHMLAEGVLCTDMVAEINVEWHTRLVDQAKVSAYDDFRLYLPFLKWKTQTCKTTAVVDFDDETYLHDGMPFPLSCRMKSPQ